jgi:FkbM family methyltransferase
MAIDFDPKTAYLEYIRHNQVEIESSVLERLNPLLENCQWEQPQTALDWNNLAVAALVAAESCDNSLTHGLYAEIAFDAVQAGAELNEHPLCAAHLALLNCMLGNYSEAAEIAFSALINNLQPAYTDVEIAPGIVYIPPLIHAHVTDGRSEQLQRILTTDNGYIQAILMLSEVLCRTQIVLDNSTGLRLLHLMDRLMPDLIFPNLRLGIYSIGDRQLEGAIYLHRAAALAPDRPIVLQALHLIYRDLEQSEIATYWQQVGKDYGNQMLAKLPWRWTELALDSPWTYVPYDRDVLLAVPATLQSATTRCLLAEGDWYERELEFWRQYLQPGMTVIDVGAGLGIYTVSAAMRVGETGCVYAIEPYDDAVDCLRETCDVDRLENVQVFQYAIGDRQGTFDLVLQAQSELNYLATGDEPLDPGTETQAVACITLDRFVAEVGIDRVEAIKISTEGNELATLIGCEQIITQFAPMIIYNSYTSKGTNLVVAQYLVDRGYNLFRYQPYLQQLIPLDSEADFAETIKAIAIPG